MSIMSGSCDQPLEPAQQKSRSTTNSPICECRVRASSSRSPDPLLLANNSPTPSLTRFLHALTRFGCTSRSAAICWIARSPRNASNATSVLECGDSVAWFYYVCPEGKESFEQSLKSSLEESVKDGKRSRIYALHGSEGKINGKFIFGSRKSAPWVGFGRREAAEGEGEYCDV